MLKNKNKGIVTELQCLLEFNKLGYHTSIPYGDNCRYDMIVDFNGVLVRMQSKKASLTKDKGSIKIKCESTYTTGNSIETKRYTKCDIDYFCTYYNNMCYLIPVEECSSCKYLRLSDAKNGQVKGISFAKDYELGVQIHKILNSKIM